MKNLETPGGELAGMTPASFPPVTVKWANSSDDTKGKSIIQNLIPSLRTS